MIRTHSTLSISIFFLALPWVAQPFLLPLDSSTSPPGGAVGGRPDPLVQGSITWLYYKDLLGAAKWYEEKLGVPLVVDQGFARVYRTSKSSFLGLVDETKGMHRASPIKPVAVAFVTDQVDAWYNWLVSQDVEIRSELKNSTTIPIRGFTAYDCEGYTLEFETFLPDPMNDEIRQILAGGDCDGGGQQEVGAVKEAA